MHVMNAYARALSAYLEGDGRTQEGLAAEISSNQPTVNRYANNKRFPDAATAREIHRATNGAVPFELWQQVAIERLGIGEAA